MRQGPDAQPDLRGPRGRLGVSSDFAGLGADADEKVSAEQVVRAGLVSVMEARQGRMLQSLFPGPLRGKRVVTPNIPDRFTCGDPELIALVTPKLRAALRLD